MNLKKYKYIASFCWGIFVIFSWYIVRFEINFNGLYGQDAHEYYRYSQALFEYFQHQIPPGDYFWPVNYPLYGALLTFLTGDNLIALQLVNVLSFLGTGLLLKDILLQLSSTNNTNNRISVFIFLSVTWFLSPMIWRSSMVVMSDMLSIALSCLALWAYIRYSKKATTLLMAIFGLAVAAAVMTRYGVAILLVLPGFAMLRLGLKNKQWMGLVIAGILAGVCLLPHIWVRGQNSGAFLGHSFLEHWSVIHWFEKAFDTQVGMVSYRLPNLVYSFMTIYHPGFSILCFVAISIFIYFHRGNFKAILHIYSNASGVSFVLAGSFLLYALFLAGIPFQNSRFVMAGYPFLILLAFPAFEYMNTKVNNIFLKTSLISLIILIQIYLGVYFFQQYYQRNQLEIALAKAVKNRPEEIVYTFGVDMAIKSYDISQHCENLWTTEYTTFAQGALVLFNEKAFAEQWKGKNPMINWNRLKQDYELDELEVLPEGWTLYKIR